jgi:hypothetical protein
MAPDGYRAGGTGARVGFDLPQCYAVRYTSLRLRMKLPSWPRPDVIVLRRSCLDRGHMLKAGSKDRQRTKSPARWGGRAGLRGFAGGPRRQSYSHQRPRKAAAQKATKASYQNTPPMTDNINAITAMTTANSTIRWSRDVGRSAMLASSEAPGKVPGTCLAVGRLSRRGRDNFCAHL